jgi:hypothetical protein
MLQERHTLTRRTPHPRRGHIYAVNTQTRSLHQHITHVHVCICMLHAHTLHATHTFAIRIYVAFMPCTHAAYEPLRCIPRTHAFQPHSCTHPLCLYAAHTRHSCMHVTHIHADMHVTDIHIARKHAVGIACYTHTILTHVTRINAHCMRHCTVHSTSEPVHTTLDCRRTV